MKLNRHQLIAIVTTILFVGVFYFGCETKDPKMKLAEKSRVANFEVTGIENIRKQAFDSLDVSQKSYFDGLHLHLKNSFDDSTKVEAMKSISGFWYSLGEYALAGEQAEEIASIQEDEVSWSIAGTTYAAGIQNGKSEIRRTFNQSKAVNAFEQAVSINPDNVTHKLNLAIVYAENPPQDQPMKGILMLLDLDKQYPDSPSVLFQLARFGMQTNQFEKAIGRLERVLAIEPNSVKAHCLIADAYQKTNNTEKAAFHLKVCQSGMK